MIPDDVDRALDVLLSGAPAPNEDAYRHTLAGGRRRIARRRGFAAGGALAVIVAAASVGVVSRDRPTPTAAPLPPVTAASTTTSTIPEPVRAAELTTLAVVSADEAWKCLDPPEHTTDGGRNWLVVPPNQTTPVQNPNVICAAARDGNAWWIRTTNDPPPREVLRVRAPAGAREFALPPFPSDSSLVELEFVDAEHGWIMINAGTSPRQDLYRTVDGGASWSIVARHQRIGYDHVFTSATRGWAEYDNQLLTTFDGGARWNRVVTGLPRVAGGGLGVQAIAAHDTSVVVLRLRWTDHTHTRVTPIFDVSTDAGKNWSRRAGPAELANRLGVNLRFDAPNAADWRLLYGKQVWATDDGGRTWAHRGDVPLAYVESMSFPTANAGWILGRTDAGRAPLVLRSSDAGTTWVDVTYGRPLNPLPSIPGGIIGCPKPPVTPAASPARPGDAPPGVVSSAVAELEADPEWERANVTATYPVGVRGAGAFASAFGDNVTSCPHPNNTRFWVVEFQRRNATRAIAVVLAHGPTGWHIFGHYP